MKYTYQVDDLNAISVFDEENPNELNAPFLHQPQHPDGTDWENRAEAEEWAEEYIAALLAWVPEEETIEPETPADPE